YMSPEQASGSSSIDSRADIYSVGLVIYEMLTGRHPFEWTSVVEALSKHLSETPLPPTRLNPHLSDSVDRVVLRALAKNPSDRQQSANELASQLFDSASQPPASLKRTSIVFAITYIIGQPILLAASLVARLTQKLLSSLKKIRDYVQN